MRYIASLLIMYIQIYPNKDYISNATPKKEDVHRLHIVNDFLEQKTTQKKTPTYAGSNASLQGGIVERARKLVTNSTNVSVCNDFINQ